MEPKNILVTGGPVHAYIDAVKLVTNRFRGRLMAMLAEQLAAHENVTYLSSAFTDRPTGSIVKPVTHDGFHDYRDKVMMLAHYADAVVLGAAVANLIPHTLNMPDGSTLFMPLKEKFPSHKFKPGDIVPMTWQVAPRIIDEVKAVMRPGAHLFGFKLLSNVSREELVAAAYGVLLESKATAVFANDAQNLNEVFAVTKERGVHPLNRRGTEVADFITAMTRDEYYRTEVYHMYGGLPDGELVAKQQMLERLIARFKDKFKKGEKGLVFGTVATRLFGGKFLTTTRGKKDMEDFDIVSEVNEGTRTVYTCGKKVTLNAPLLNRIFLDCPNVHSIVHYHEQEQGLSTLPYAPPGTVRDSQRVIRTSFNVANHGAFLLLDDKENQI